MKLPTNGDHIKQIDFPNASCSPFWIGGVSLVTFRSSKIQDHGLGSLLRSASVRRGDLGWRKWCLANVGDYDDDEHNADLHDHGDDVKYPATIQCKIGGDMFAWQYVAPR